MSGARSRVQLSYHIHTNTLIDFATDWQRYLDMLQRAQLWGVDPVTAIREFAPRLNYFHLQDYSARSRDPDGTYQPVWCGVGDAELADFPAVLTALAKLGFQCWITDCPRSGYDPPTEADLSKRVRNYLRQLAY